MNKKLNSLHATARKIRAISGGSGSGDKRVGKRGEDTVIEIPPGTIIKELWRAPPEAVSEAQQGADEEDIDEMRRERAWIHYPGMEEANKEHALFQEVDKALKKSEKSQVRHFNKLDRQSIEIDVGDIEGKHLIATGGQGGVPNTAFVTNQFRTPKFARRGEPGEHLKLSLELKLLADVGLVGLPNAGKSSVLAALTSSKTKIANYAFTTLKPEVGVVNTDSLEPRFTILDNPGLIADAAQNKGLGHTFLRAVERALVLVYVVDFSKDEHLDDLDTLIKELNEYKDGLAQCGTVIVANKADLMGGNPQENEIARDRLRAFQQHVDHLKEQRVLQSSTTLIPLSAKHNANLKALNEILVEKVQKEKETI
ncbi:P-loop containing nucleoside triphosphate hydrolase protein [Wallemia mellicola]|nr:hypothetical protein E3Q24_00328 [Wallemia mellicola]TIB82764.1 P-loop containing nucleoside triphosphate hydrolase protein [Wallemia mellicola]TIB83918.1 P-loop containing nucleoside triphosphate hydrolase protein [Wallemia mellicola]TIB99910.1 P-loop containing nucleoside triphosphate hydrolase protein [Wallemia mellicola]TIC12265.1 P-loop containing nucleoside triphosphate hydrolase protein [Wallemia mellicola]